MNDEKNKQTTIPVDDGFNKDDDTSTSPIDERTDQEKALERIESIEVHHTDKNVDKSIDGVKGGFGSLVDGKQPGTVASGAPERVEATSIEKNSEHPALLAARKKAKGPKVRSQRKAPAVLILLLLFLLAAVAAAGWFFYQHQEAQQELSQVQEGLIAKDQKIDSLAAANAKLTEASEVSDKKNHDQQQVKRYREIPEWNIRYELTETNKDLAYGVSSLQDNAESLGFMSLNVAREVGTNKDTQQLSCGVGSAGMIMRLTEAGKKEYSQGQELASQKVGEYYYVYVSPQSLCSDAAKQEQEAAAAAVGALPKTFESLPSN